MGIAQKLGTPFKNTWGFLVAQGCGKPETRRLPYDDYGLVTIAAITGSSVAQAVATASHDGSTSGMAPGDFVFLEFGLADEEHVNMISVDTVNQTITVIEHPALDLSDRRAPLGKRRGVRHQGGRFTRFWFRPDRGDPDVSCLRK